MKDVSCDRCNAVSSVYLPYSKIHLCRAHFFELIERRFRATVRENKLIQKGDRIAVGLSGGKDSTVLLHLLASLRKSLPFELVAITVDEGIAGYRAPTLAVAKREAKKLKVKHAVVSFKNEAGRTLDRLLKDNQDALPCSYCGVIRRQLLNKAARKLGADKIAIGHNLDDVAQTVFMNLMRNEPLRLVRFGEPLVEDEAFISRIRPLMRIPEREIAMYAMLKGIHIDFRECPYAHSALRQDVRGMLNDLEEKHPGTKYKIFNSFTLMHAWMRKGIGETGFKLAKCADCGEPFSGKGKLCMYCMMVGGSKKK